MAQAQMQKSPAATKPASPAEPSAPAGQPMAGANGMQQPPTEGKKMAWWMWLIIAVVVIGIGWGIYHWLM